LDNNKISGGDPLNRNVQIIGIIVILLLIVGAASVFLPAIQEQIVGSTSNLEVGLETENEPVEIDLGGFLLGEELEQITPLNDLLNGREVNPLFLLVGSLVLIGGAVVTFGLVLALIMRLLDRTVTNTYSDEGFQEATKTLETREKEENKELAKTKPPTDLPDHVRPRSQAYVAIALILFLVGIAAIVVAESLNVDIQVEIFVVGVTIVAALVAIMLIRPEQFADPEKENAATINWSTVWVVLSGLIFLGIGLGLVVAIRSLAG
jgi:hypothetical protein